MMTPMPHPVPVPWSAWRSVLHATLRASISDRVALAAAGCAFFMKQLSHADTRTFKDFDSFPPDLRIREMPNAA